MNEPVSAIAVAVIVPVFNRLELLRQTVASLRAQTMARAEFILVDDRSDEAT
jgi:glycosyltransferase involved in cell wall biosynthesis